MHHHSFLSFLSACFQRDLVALCPHAGSSLSRAKAVFVLRTRIVDAPKTREVHMSHQTFRRVNASDAGAAIN